MDRFVLCWWPVVAGGVEAAVVEPVEVLQGGQFEVVDGAPRPVAANQLDFEQSV
jgi:hypothetical protein